MGVEEAVMLPMQDMQIWKGLLSRNDVINEIGGSAAPLVTTFSSLLCRPDEIQGTHSFDREAT